MKSNYLKGEFNPEQVDKIFALENEDTMNKFKSIVSNIPMEMVEITERIITYAQARLGKSLNDSIYIHLTDHIHFAIERYKNNQPIKME
ncbi:PRD domain-containing protein [Oceanobacillus sp. CFH 90083]|uniref:PRD domain-containing protein n=1 Tax=Oceanobacillus sp. CFH 90083 TaxID=2592336 RepID=UPI001D158868|nr:PRD domain-containing protein [Oceanobacillus sp. CFH 90083]